MESHILSAASIPIFVKSTCYAGIDNVAATVKALNASGTCFGLKTNGINDLTS